MAAVVFMTMFQSTTQNGRFGKKRGISSRHKQIKFDVRKGAIKIGRIQMESGNIFCSESCVFLTDVPFP
jgi:hypothetical protein